MQTRTDARIVHLNFDFSNATDFDSSWYQSCPTALNHLCISIALQEKCSDIIDYAAAEFRDLCDGFQATMNCPVLSSLASADRTKAVASNCFVIYILHSLLYDEAQTKQIFGLYIVHLDPGK